MKKKLLALSLSLSLLLTGCSAMLERDYLSVTPHDRLPQVADASNAVWVSSYTELLSAILSQVTAHQEVGMVRLRNWKSDVQTSLDRACEEVSRTDPLGAYAIERISPAFTFMVTYYEATITIDYSHTAEQIAAVTTITGSGAIRAELRDALAGFVTETAFRVNYLAASQDAEYIRRLIREAYYDQPVYALGMPQAQVNLYPESGSNRVVEVVLVYPEDPEALREKSGKLLEAAEVMAEPYRAGPGGAALCTALFESLREKAAPPEEEPPQVVPGSTAYAALVEGAADSEGLALAYQLLCRQEGLESYVVSGGVEGAPHFWNIVETGDGEYRHVDASLEEGFALSDADLAALGYVWDKAEYRACGAQPPEPELEPGQEQEPGREALAPDALPEPSEEPAEDAENPPL